MNVEESSDGWMDGGMDGGIQELRDEEMER